MPGIGLVISDINVQPFIPSNTIHTSSNLLKLLNLHKVFIFQITMNSVLFTKLASIALVISM